MKDLLLVYGLKGFQKLKKNVHRTGRVHSPFLQEHPFQGLGFWQVVGSVICGPVLGEYSADGQNAGKAQAGEDSRFLEKSLTDTMSGYATRFEIEKPVGGSKRTE